MAASRKPASFTSSVSLTHISTATAILSIDGVNFLTDPAFDPKGSKYPVGNDRFLERTAPTALQLYDLPPFETVLLSHEDHADNLDVSGRTLLNGRHVLTTQDGAKKLAPRPGVRGLAPWETTQLTVGGRNFAITATPCDHLPGGECIGFIIHTDTFGQDDNGRPNVIYLSGDTVYVAEVAQRLHKDYNVVLAVLNLGAATVPLPSGPLVITLDGQQAIRFASEIDADAVVPLHYESWSHFAESQEEMKRVVGAESNQLKDKFLLLEPGKSTRIL